MITTDFVAQRANMIKRQIADRGVKNPLVLTAMQEVPRECFVPEALSAYAYDDRPLAVLAGQTISQPYIVALMIEALTLQGKERVLDIGTGSGYAAAVLSRIAADVYSMECLPELLAFAQPRFEQLGYSNIYTQLGDGTLGWPQHAPYDAILVSAAGPEVPQGLRQQLALGGRLVIPIGSEHGIQTLVRKTRTAESQFERSKLCGVRFVPLVSKQGWPRID